MKEEVFSAHRGSRIGRTKPRSLFGTFIMLLASACGETGLPGHLQFETCADSPTELLRLEGTAAGLSIDAFDLGDAISVRYALQSESDPSRFSYPERFSVVDNCGGEPLRLADSFELPSGAANVGGEVVLCAGDDYLGEDAGLWQLLDDGTRGEDLGLGAKCSTANPGPGVREPSFGIVYDAGVATQHLPDGTSRVISTGDGFELFPTSAGAVVFSFGESPEIHPPGGGPAIELDLPEPIYAAYPPPGGTSASGWVLAMPRAGIDGGSRPEDFPLVPGYAVELSTGSWFVTPEVSVEFPSMRSEFSIRDGLMATDSGDGFTVSRPGWDRHLLVASAVRAFAVLDADRLFIIRIDALGTGGEELRVIAVPKELPPEGVDLELEVLWSRPGGADEFVFRGAGFGWNDMALAESSSSLWAYPLDGNPAFSFVPVSTYSYVGANTITGLGVPPESHDDKLWLFQRSIDGELEVIAEELASGQDDFMGHPWTPELGRVLHSVRDGDAVSIRQHRLVP